MDMHHSCTIRIGPPVRGLSACRPRAILRRNGSGDIRTLYVLHMHLGILRVRALGATVPMPTHPFFSPSPLKKMTEGGGERERERDKTMDG